MFAALSPKERVLATAAGAVFAVSVVFLLGRLAYVQTEVVPARGGEYTEGFVGQPAYVNPVLAAGDVDRSIARLLFSSIEQLADHVEASKDQRTWKVRLRPGLLWSDGRKLTSDDIVFTVEQIRSAETRSPLQPSVQGVTALRMSELEVQFSLVGPYAFFGDTLRAIYPIPKHLFADVPPPNWRLSDYNLKPVGSGPYVFERFEKEATGFIKEYRMKPNPRYFGGAPYIETVRFAFFPDGNALAAAFNKGAVDGVTSPDLGALSGVKRSYRTHAFRIPSYYAIFFNQSQSIALKEGAVREALAASIDRDALIETVFRGYALPAFGPVPPASGSATATSTGHDRDRAARLLDDAGWKAGEDGAREKKMKEGAIKFELILTVPEIPFLANTVEEIKTAWQRLGLQVTVAPLPSGETMAKTIRDRDYQALLFGNVLSPSLDLHPFWHSKERFAPGLNLALYANPRADELLDAIQREENADARAAKRGEAERLIAGDLPAIFLYSPDYLYLASKEVRGVEPRMIAEPADRFLALPQWYVKTSRAVK